MNKFKTVLIVLLALLVVSFLLSSFFSDISSKNIGSRVAVIQIYGPITIGHEPGILDFSRISIDDIQNALTKAKEDSSIKGLILEINSPGGTVVASEELARSIKNFDKPTVAWIREQGTSGAYWVASSADVIVADPLSITGSIGVIGSYLEFSDLFEKYGVGYEQLVSGPYKDTGSPFRELTDDERHLLQSKIDKIHEFFKNEISRNRNLQKSKIDEIADGSFYLGIEAKEIGLVDVLGGKEEAINEIKTLAHLKEVNLVTYQRKSSLLNLISGVISYNFFNLGRGIAYGTSEIANTASFEFKT